MNTNQIFSEFLRYGDVNRLKTYHCPDAFLSKIAKFDEHWKQYNTSKNVRRYGLSITSLDGGFSGIPDLDSIPEFNRRNNTSLTELDINMPTQIFEYALPYFEFVKNDIGRSHVIKLAPGGFFPIHRDNMHKDIVSFRLFVPLKNCNPPECFFMLGHNYDIVNFCHGYTYFFNSCLPHTIFNASFSDSYFIVINVKITEDSLSSVISNFSAF